MYSNKCITCVYCGHTYFRSGKISYCPKCGADPDEELVVYAHQAGWCDTCVDVQLKLHCKETGLCPKVRH